MLIYQTEKDDGMHVYLNKDGSSIVTAKVQVGNIGEHFNGMSVADLVKATSTVQTVEQLLGQDQPDLSLVVAILVSTGWNLNDDLFLPDEVWKARNSAVHKPMNDNHQGDRILGHIVDSRVLDKSGNEIKIAEGEAIPVEFDIEVAGVLYRAFPALTARIDEIITKAKAGEMFVSMECWFPDFGYGFIDPTTGETKLVERTEATAFLTKHLRIYGGSGQYQGYKVGRVLRDMIFGAQGFVETPANPESVIKVAAHQITGPLVDAANRVFVTAELNEILEGGVQDVTEQEMKELQEKLEKLQANLVSKEQEVVELTQAAEEFKSKDFDGQIVALTEEVEKLTAEAVEASENTKVMETAGTELQKQLDEVTQRAEKSEAELDEIRKNEAARGRLAKLSEVKKIENEEATLAELRDMTEETFEVVLKYAGETQTAEVVSEEPGKKADATDAETDGEGDAEQTIAALDNVDVDTSADMNASKDSHEMEADIWVSAAQKLCGQLDEKEGGE